MPLAWDPKENDRLCVGEDGSENTSRSIPPNPLALSFMMVSFSGVISGVALKVSVIMAVEWEDVGNGKRMDGLDCKWELGKWTAMILMVAEAVNAFSQQQC